MIKLKKVLSIKVIEGFTLLEILVVIGIIGILVGLGAISYSTAQKKARDSKRKSDLRTIQSAMEQCYSINGYQYPNLPVAPLSGKTLPDPCSSLITFPSDPLGDSYRCSGTCDETTYKICPPLSVNSGKMLETEDCSTENCCLSNQQ